MSWTLLAPAFSIVVTLVVLAWAMHRIEAELQELRLSLRRSRVATVATDELQRDARRVAFEIERIDEKNRQRRERRRARDRR